ncbi:bacteriocin biosynthesis cyclodehydratase [Listeria seeligeri]|uniref:bacteriocin biosynthesis cyclodehydratase n=1 Tax=Listeria seeligeri TaxID=1640 RepID=UPI002B25BAC7|nr:bacteriocin biosynthesis cyclodehydratase [Listeria seeligeri]
MTLSSENSVYNDLETLLKFGFLTTYDSQGVRALLVIEDNLLDIAKNYFHGEIDIISSSEFFLVKELQSLVENKDILKITKLAKEKEEILKDFNHVYLISNISNISLLRGFNKLMQLINQVNTIAFFDNENVFISCIEHGETGCYECLEQQLLTHFEGLTSDYLDVPENNVSTAELLFVIALIKKEIENISIYGQSSLLGNLIHFNFNNYEYAFNTNRIQSCCSTCATINNVLFEEQNIRSINILKELMSND